MRAKCRSDGVIVPDSAWSGVYVVPVISPTGARVGVTNGEREPTAVVGPPGAFDGSGNTGGGGGTACAAVAACCASAGSCVSSAPPAATAAPVRSDRRVIGVSFMRIVERLLLRQHRRRHGHDRRRRIGGAREDFRWSECFVSFRVVRNVFWRAAVGPIVLLAR